MKAILSSLFCSLALGTLGQSQWSSLFHTDPELSDGYFIVDQNKANALGVARVEVDIIAAELRSDGSVNSSVIETLVIVGGFFAQADFDLWDGLQDPFRIIYHAQGFDSGGNPVVDVQNVPVDHQPWPELCRETCESNLYAYTLIAYSNGAESIIEIQDGHVNGSAGMLYVKASDWPEFQDMFHPQDDFGFGIGTWSEILTSEEPQGDVIHIDYPAESAPAGARDYMGYLLGPVTQDVFAVRKGKGPWVGLYGWTEEMAAQGVCINSPGHLRALYNADQNVQNRLDNYNMPDLNCMGMMVLGGGVAWGSGSSSWCSQYHIDEQTWGDPPNYLGSITMTVIGCVQVTLGFDPNGIPTTGSGPDGTYVLADVANILLSR